MKVFMVQAEHPYEPFYPMFLFASRASADAKAFELTNDLVEAVNDVLDDDGEVKAVPAATVADWPTALLLAQKVRASGGEAEAFAEWDEGELDDTETERLIRDADGMDVWITEMEVLP
jgi:hypothetical protein